jgi:TPR repeat protein
MDLKRMHTMRSRVFSTAFLMGLLLASCAPGWGQSGSPDALYERGLAAITGVGESRNDAAGIDYFRRSSDLGFGPAQVALGYYYEMGIVPGNQGQPSLDLYKKAAQRGDPLAAWMLGRRYYLGIGVPQDQEAAKKWFKISVDQKNAYGAYYLGRALAETDPAKALGNFKFAAEQGLPQAQYFYGKALKDGTGGAADKFNAYVWLLIAADAGYDAAADSLNHMRGMSALTVDEINQAEAKAKGLEQTVVRAVTARGCSGWDGEFAEFPTPPPPNLQSFCR